MKLTEKEEQARKRVCLALDVPTTSEALSLAGELSDLVGMCKIGKELHTSACNEGVPIVREIYNKKGSSFLDLKYHDTPNTVYGAAKASAVPGVSFFNIHLGESGEPMCEKALEGAYKGAQERGIERPGVIGVTVLTSIDDSDLKKEGINTRYDELVERRTELARRWGLDGVVCPASKAGGLEKMGYDFKKVTPGIKWAGVQRKGQKQLYTPDLAVQDCSNSILIIGGAITTAGNVYEKENGKNILVKKGTVDDRRKASYEILQAMAKYL
ncbi:MAG: orotidine-5'-phosphate decarboxylase [Candidatus Pacearchaeota archaeon]|jgi:orotidine-5'-phosphate decarboxylase